jgi:hypothetical protein
MLVDFIDTAMIGQPVKRNVDVCFEDLLFAQLPRLKHVNSENNTVGLF